MEILDVRLQTVRPDSLRRFYAGTLGQPLAVDGDALSGTVGSTTLTFSPAGAGAAPVYHLAFTVPRNKLALAKSWIAERTPLLTDPDGRDEFRFDTWEATSIYFADPAGTILELIAWEALANDATGPFGPADLLAVSEVGLVVDDVPATVAELREMGFSPYQDEWSPDFAPVGDPVGRLIVVPPGRPWFPVGWAAASAPLALTLRGDEDARWSPRGTRAEITTRR